MPSKTLFKEPQRPKSREPSPAKPKAAKSNAGGAQELRKQGGSGLARPLLDVSAEDIEEDLLENSPTSEAFQRVSIPKDSKQQAPKQQSQGLHELYGYEKDNDVTQLLQQMIGKK